VRRQIGEHRKDINMKARRARSGNGGFTLIEALVALLVLAFGMLAVAGFQMQLSRGSDIAKQRTQATRLAQEKIEELRSFEQLTARVGKFSFADLATGTDAQQTVGNMAYTRSWSVSGTATDPYRVASVTVAWTDRANEAQTVNLASVISRSDPADVGGLTVPPIENGILRRPFRRSINIPVPAIQLGGRNAGKSTLQWQPGGWLVFSDAVGDVISKCTNQPDDDTIIEDVCTTITGYLLTGFVNDGGTSNNTWDLAWTLTGADIDIATRQHITAVECFVSAATDQNNGTPLNDFLFYACLIQPQNHDSNPATPPVWSGKLVFAPAPTGTQRVCRYDGNLSDANGVYQLVEQSLENQNYKLIASGSCGSGLAIHQQP